jgi:hypothetical protein
MGMSSYETIENWVRAALEADDFGTASRAVKDYFDLT